MTDSTPLLNRSKVRRSQHFPRLDASNECQYVTRSVMRQISRNLVVFMSASPCTSNYETGSYVVRVKVMLIASLIHFMSLIRAIFKPLSCNKSSFAFINSFRADTT